MLSVYAENTNMCNIKLHCNKNVTIPSGSFKSRIRCLKKREITAWGRCRLRGSGCAAFVSGRLFPTAALVLLPIETLGAGSLERFPEISCLNQRFF